MKMKLNTNNDYYNNDNDSYIKRTERLEDVTPRNKCRCFPIRKKT